MSAALESARRKAYWRLLPLLFTCYVIAFIDRTNVAIASLTMTRDLPYFTDAVIGTGAGMFFLGYFLLEIPGSLIVERWSARKWICRIMVTWGFMAALTAAVKTPGQFYAVRFLLGLSEAGFFPGVVIFLSHWFTSRDRARALATFMMATPLADVISPKVSNFLLKIGTTEMINGVQITHDKLLGMDGWQWIYIFWGVPAVLLGIIVLVRLPDRPHQARWLANDEAEALETELAEEKAGVSAAGPRPTVLQALGHPKVLLLGLAYFLTVTGSYGIQFFMPRILHQWYNLQFNTLTWLVILPPLVAAAGSMTAGWSSDKFRERRLHTVVPIAMGATAVALIPSTQGNLALTIVCFIAAYVGFKSYIPVFWTLPSLLLTEAAAAGSIGLINSIGNLGGYMGPKILGEVRTLTGSFVGGLYVLCTSMFLSATLLFFLGLGKRATAPATVPAER